MKKASCDSDLTVQQSLKITFSHFLTPAWAVLMPQQGLMAVPAGKADPTLREQKNPMFKPSVVPANQPDWGVCSSPPCGFVARLSLFICGCSLGFPPGLKPWVSLFSCPWQCGSLLQELITSVFPFWGAHVQHQAGTGSGISP